MSLSAMGPVGLLTLAVIFVNGWTDAPNAIATAVASGTLSFRRAAGLAAAGNLAGAVLSTLFFPAVARTVWSLAGAGGGALVPLAPALGAIVLWAVAAWRFGIPTSESHALLGGLAGAALSIPGGWAGVDRGAWWAALGGLVLSLALGFALGCLSLLLLRPLSLPPAALRRGQICGAAAMAFLHGAQDGQKFAGLLLFSLSARGLSPWTAALTCAVVMALGTLLGGRPIVEKVGKDLVPLSPRSGLAADLGGGMALLFCTLAGLPVSTTHAKTAAVAGAGWASGQSVNRRAWRELILTWLFTFPGCMALAFILARLPFLSSI